MRNEPSASIHRPSGPQHSGPHKGIDLDAVEDMLNRRLRSIWVRHTWFIGALLLFALVAVIGVSIFLTVKPVELRIAVGPVGSGDVRFVELLRQRLDAQHDSTRLHPVVFNAPVGVSDIRGKSDFDLAVVRGNMDLPTEWPVVAILRQNVVALIVPAPSTRMPAKDGKGNDKGKDAKAAKPPKIAKVSDLAGKRIGIVTSTDGGRDLLGVILRHYGIAKDQVTISDISQSELGRAIAENRIDVVLAAGPPTGKIIEDAINAASRGKDGPTFIPIDQAEGIGKRVPAYDSIEIKAGQFGGVPPQPADTLTTLSYPLYLVARQSYSDDRIAAFSKSLYASRQTFAHELPGVIDISAPSTDKDASVIVHAGTAAYLGDNIKTVFDKYGDQIFYGLLIFPVIGSAFAGLFGYFRADKSTQRIRQLHRLLQVIRRARAVTSLDELDALQDEADSILGETIQQSERGVLDEMGLATFSLAIEQARLALSEQRSLLVLRPENVPQHEPRPKGKPPGGPFIAAE